MLSGGDKEGIMEADQRALWYYPEDKTEPVITAARQIVSKYGSDGWRKLPPKAVVFCMGKGLPILEANFSTEQLLETLPGFISPVSYTHLDVYKRQKTACSAGRTEKIGRSKLRKKA